MFKKTLKNPNIESRNPKPYSRVEMCIAISVSIMLLLFAHRNFPPEKMELPIPAPAIQLQD